MSRRRLLLALLAVLPLLLPPWAAGARAAEGDPPGGREVVRELRQEEALRRLREEVEALNRELSPYLPPLDADAAAEGNPAPWTVEALVRGLGDLLLDEVRSHLSLLGQLLLLAVFCAILQQVHESFAESGVGQVAKAVIFLALFTLALAGFHTGVDVAGRAVGRMSDFMLASLPLLTTLLAASGALVSAGLFHPLVLFTVHSVGWLTGSVIFPLLFLGTLLDLVSGFSGSFRLDRLAGLFKHVGIGLLALALTLFTGVIAIQGAAGSVADGLGLRTAKFAAHFIPVVGGMFADAAELVVNASLLVRNGVGILGLTALLAVVAIPLLKLVAMIFVYRLAGALVQPVGAEEIGAALTTIGGGLTLLALALAGVGLMFLVALAILVGVGNVAVMFR